MKLLLTINERDFTHVATEGDRSRYQIRRASRAVLVNESGQVYLMNVSLHGYHKLPGGGIDEGESIELALARELMEEVGCKADIVCELGEIIEYRDFDELCQTSYCFLAKQTGEQQDSALEEGELAEGMIEVKTETIDAAIELLTSDIPDSLEGKFIQKRDIAFLEAAKSVSSQ